MSKWLELIKKYSEMYRLDPKLISAIIKVESGGDQFAIRYEPNYKYFVTPAIFAHKNLITEATERLLQQCSLGLMQVMGGVVREHGYTGQLCRMFYPDMGIEYGCKVLHKLSTKYKKTSDIIAAYNAGSVIILKSGGYYNQGYVDKVLKTMLGEAKV